jgi:ABC-2 type transport system permease protein
MNKLFKPYQLAQLISALFKELIREPEVLFWGIGFPILMSLGLGIAFTKKPDMVINVAVLDAKDVGGQPENSTNGIEYFLERNAEKLPGIGKSTVRYKIVVEDDKIGNTIFFFRKTSWEEGLTFLKRGLLSMIINEVDGEIHYHFDPLNPTAQLTYLKLKSILSGDMLTQSDSTQNIEPLRVIGSRYIDFFVPGLIAMGIMMSGMWGLSYRLIEMRSQKLLRRMVATPMKKSHLLIAMTLVRTLMSFFEALLLFLFAFLVFDIRIQGSLFALFLIVLAGNIAFAGIAIFVSSRTARTETGNGLINIVVMPMTVLSGIFFSYHNFPDWAVPVIQKFPLTMLADGIRSVFIEGAGVPDIMLPFLFLLSIGIVFFAAGLKIFKWH